MKIVFFGSSSDSLIVLTKLHDVVAIVTQPPKPVGRKKVPTATPIELWAKAHTVLVCYSATDAPQSDLLITASYGEKIPMETIRCARYGGLNVHPSLLPRWRGADPVPWAILSGDRETGVTVVTLAQEFDEGSIIAQKKIPITNTDMTDPLRARLFEIGAQLLVDCLPDYISGKLQGTPQTKSPTPYAKRLTRADGFEPWEKLIDPKESERINRKFRAFHPWPGLWTMIKGKRLKILDFDTAPKLVQLEGKKPVSYKQFTQAYISS